jgi:hypothetical protein
MSIKDNCFVCHGKIDRPPLSWDKETLYACPICGITQSILLFGPDDPKIDFVTFSCNIGQYKGEMMLVTSSDDDYLVEEEFSFCRFKKPIFFFYKGDGHLLIRRCYDRDMPTAEEFKKLVYRTIKLLSFA